MIQSAKAVIQSAVRAAGFELRRLPTPGAKYTSPPTVPGYDRAHYGCGHTRLEGWLNIDTPPRASWPGGDDYVGADITERHPIASNSLRYAYCEDVLEHLSQEQSLRFLSEVKRTLAPGGVARLSFPAFESVLDCYDGTFEAAAGQGRDCFDLFGHVHFYCRESLALVARKLGFSRVEFYTYRESPHADLRDLDDRPAQAGMNIFAELTK